MRFGGEGDREFELALLAMAQLRDGRAGAVAEPYPLQRGARRLAQLWLLAGVGPEAEGVAGMRLRRQRDIVGGGEVGQQRGDLERTRQPEPAAAVGRQPGDVLAGEANGAGMRQQLPGELADQRGLAGAVRPDDGVQFAAANLKRDLVGGDHAAEPADQIFDVKQGFNHGAASRAARQCRRVRTARSGAAADP